MAGQISFELVTPEGLKLHEEVYEVLLPAPQGQIGILPNHMPLISVITPGVISVKRHADDPDEDVEILATSGGLLEVDGQRARLLADTAERADDIDEMRAKEALERAKEIQKTAKDQISLAEATSIIEQSAARLKVAELKRKHHR